MNFRKFTQKPFQLGAQTPILLTNVTTSSNKYTKKTWSYLALLTLITLCCYWFWFFDWGIITAGDWGYLGSGASRELWGWPSMIDRFGKTSLTIQTAPIFALWGGLSYFFSFEVVSRLVYLFPGVLLSLYGIFVLTHHLTRSDLAAFVGSIVFNSSIYFLMIRQGHLLLVCAYGVMPWIIYYFIRLMNERKIWQAIVLSLLAFLCGSFEFRGLYVTLWLTFVYYLYYNLVESRRWRVWWHTSLLSALTFGLFAIYNFYWLIPFSQLEVLSQNSLFERPIITSEFFDLVRAFAMFIIWWSGSSPTPTWVVPLNFFIAPIAALFGFYLNRKNSKVVFFAVISVFGIFLSKQAGEPFPDFYEWLYKNFIGFAAFREASKFYAIISLGYSVLIAALVVWLLHHWRKTFWQRVGQISIILLIIGSFLWHNRPMINQEYGALTVPKTLPSEFAKFNEFISSQTDDFYILGVPFVGNWFSSVNNHQAIDLVQAVQTDWSKVMDLPLRSIENPITTREITVNLLDKSFFEQFARQLGIKYLVLPREDKLQNPSQLAALGGRDFYLNSLQKIPFIKPLDIGSGELLVFENMNYKANRNLASNVYEIQTANNLSPKAKFIKQNLDGEFNFYLNDELKKDNSKLPTTKIVNLFEDLQPDQIKTNQIVQKLTGETGFDYQLFYNQNRKEITAKFQSGLLQILAANSSGLAVNGQKLNLDTSPKVLWEIELEPEETYYLTFQGTETLLEEGTQSLGFSNQSEEIGLFQKSSINLVPNSSFDEGLWDKNFNCTSQSTQVKGQKIVAEANIKSDKDRKKFLELVAQNQNACNQIGFNIEPNQGYVFDFEVASSGRSANFLMGSNDPNAQVIQNTFPIIKPNTWQKYQQIFHTEAGTTRTNILLTNQSDGEETVTTYDNFGLFKLDLVNSFVFSLPNETIDFVQVPLEFSPNTEISYDFDNKKYGQNWIQNGDFENGLWAKSEGKCAGDSNKNQMAAARERDSQVVKLSTVRQSACTRTTIPVKSNTAVLFSFDYKSNTNYLSAYMAFNGSDKIIRQPNTFIKDTNWHTYTSIFKTPNDTSLAELIIYTQGESNNREIVNFYDNFKMTVIPDFSNQFFLIKKPKQKFEIPEQAQIEKVSFTKKNFKFQNLKENFFLSIRDSYNPNWKLTSYAGSSWESLSPLTKANWLEISNFKTNLNQNSWLIDLDYLCKKRQICQQNPDGSYNLDLTVEFWPQRWLNVGLFLSVLALGSAILVLLFIKIKNYD